MSIPYLGDVNHGGSRDYTLFSGTTAVGAQTVTAAIVVPALMFNYAMVDLNLTAAATDAADTLDVYVDTSLDAGTLWVNVVHFTQILGNGGAKRETVVINPSGSVAVAPVNTAADAAAGAVRNILGGRFRVRYVQVDANSNAAFAFTVKLRVG